MPDSKAPSVEALCDYLTGRLDAKSHEEVARYFEEHPDETFFIEKAKELLSSKSSQEDMAVPEEWVERAKNLMKKNQAQNKARCPHCGGAITPFKKPLGSQRFLIVLWSALALTAFTLSFVIRHYFVQWTALALVFAVKAMIDQRSAKTQILIYKALSEEQGQRDRDLQGLRSRL